MASIRRFLIDSLMGFLNAIKRFPLTVASLAALTALTWHIISLRTDPSVNTLKWVFILLLSAFVGLSVQFVAERFQLKLKGLLLAYGIGLLVVAGYAFLIWPSPEINYLVGTRTSIAVLVSICVMVIAPAYRKGFDFNQICLVHFKSAFTAILFALVIFAGLSAILTAINLLLFRLNSDYMAYTASVVWIFFALTYYSSLLPEFNATDEAKQALTLERVECPKFLRILIAYVAIPLISAYTLVLLAYFAKIAFTQVWPIGQLGPMILGYSVAGFILFILSSNIDNKFSKLYQTWFPRILIPIVVMQQMSVAIRINAYGFTESRYYLALFGLFSIAMGLSLSIKRQLDHQWIALILMVLSLVSILPPVDAFSLSRASQKARLEELLSEAGLLQDGQLSSKTDTNKTVRLETTSIIEYMDRRHYLKDLVWLDPDFNFPYDFKDSFGFETTYVYAWEGQDSFYAGLAMDGVLDIAGYDRLFRVGLYRQMDPQLPTSFDFSVNDLSYRLDFERIDENEVRVRVVDAQNNVLVETGLYAFVESLRGESMQMKDAMAIEAMTLDVENKGVRLRIVFQFINVIFGGMESSGADYDLFVLVDVSE